MTFISIIIPFNRPERYLKDCLDSLAEQNLDDEEIILVLNGLTEDIGELLNDYDLNIITKSFESEIGVSKARNEALKMANGEYVYFIDSDDYIYLDGLSKLINVAKSTNADFINGEKIITGYIRDRFSEELENLARDKIYPLTKNKLSDEEFSLRLLVGDKTEKFEVLSALHCLIKREKISDIYFDESVRHQCDYEFMVEVMNNVNSMVGVEDALYAKRVSDDFLNLPCLNQEMEDGGFLVYAQNYKDAYNSINNSLLKQIMNQKLFRYFYDVYSIKFYSDSNKKWRNEYFDAYAELVQDVSFEKVSFFKKRELKALQARDKNKLRKLLKMRINFNKLFDMNNSLRIKIAIYYKFFNKKGINKNQIIFCSFKGDYYSDSPKYIYEYLYENYKDDYDFVWVLNDKKVKIPGNPKRVTRFSLEYFKEVARSKYWVINGRQFDPLDKKDSQVIVSTWHGTPLKKLGLDIGNVYTMNPFIKHSYVNVSKQWDYLISPNRYTTNILKSCFGYQKEIFESGYPRNDILYNADEEMVNRIKSSLNIPEDKKVILYAPTWRDDEFIDAGLIKFQLKLELDKLKEAFSDEYIILIRTHYFIADKLDLSGVEDFAIDVSKYNDIAELYLISDLLITDYSSVFFDFANLKRPILYYTYDLDKYENVLRGFYIDIRKEVPGPLLETTDEVIDAIRNIDQLKEEYKEKYDQFYERFCSIDDGNASKRIVEKVWKK
ncbi:bifunctional glycosyltransferase/CDP-glycerol:glycerophosphate glycerophosphotransferase [Methanobrevibacter sp.]|uniref:bifunctional glycosyltransferase/CDP-glycerol:glycerophosphate glycerophosphotransferase n=1 Tax=Methanobrevibacter sp. TaxID=66852 RepID=UPI002E799570|nr:CDP-glycerol glycerophosphotransferase family protein [Methanobrevibacter sp.]MEE1335841.1 CDP-glycerol glycerophosphotransferase family protein [Methanobrevibacter sp.]